jgi:hypothetical protein
MTRDLAAEHLSLDATLLHFAWNAVATAELSNSATLLTWSCQLLMQSWQTLQGEGLQVPTISHTTAPVFLLQLHTCFMALHTVSLVLHGAASLQLSLGANSGRPAGRLLGDWYPAVVQ